MFELARRMVELQEQAASAYSPIVDALVRNDRPDLKEIERTLDHLLSFCGHPQVLELFKRLCRHLYSFDQAAASDYVNFYREMWDSESSV